MLIKLRNIQKTYSTKNGVTFRALNGVSLSFEGTGLVYLVGASGSGKSTLLNVIGGLDTYDSGEYILAGRKMNELKNSEVDSLRNKLMGFVFQEFNLIDTLSVYENVKLALDMQSEKNPDAVHDALKAMGIDDKAKNKTKDLSGGQRQRVAIARALVKNPRIILADEPTGSLDSATTEEVINILKDLSKDRLVIAVTHDMDMAVKTGDRIIEMKDGCVYRDVRRRGENESLDNSQTELFSDTLMSVPPSAEVEESDVERLNEIMEQSVRKTYINVETDPRKVKALFPNLREAIGSKKAKRDEGEDGALASDEFMPYKPADTAMESVEFKKSRLPLLHSMRLALNNLNFKKARLVLTVIVAFFAFVMFGVAQSFTSFDLKGAYVATLREESYSAVGLYPSGIFGMAANDYAKLREKTEGVTYSERYNLSYTPMSDSYLPDYGYDDEWWYGYSDFGNFTGFKGTVETEDMSHCGYTMLYGSSRPHGYDGIIISEYAARSLIDKRVIKADSLGDMVGMTLAFTNGRNFVIDGIFACDGCEELMHDYSWEASETLNTKSTYGWGQLYVLPGFVKYYDKLSLADGTNMYVELAGANTAAIYQSSINYTVEFVRGGTKGSGYTVRPVVGSGVIEREGDIIVSREGLRYIYGADGNDVSQYINKIAELNADSTRRLVLRTTLRTGKDTVYATADFRIVGIIEGKDGVDYYSSSTVLMHENVASEVLGRSDKPNSLIADIRNVDRSAFVKAVYDNGFMLNDEFTSHYVNALDIMAVLRYVLLVLAIIFCLLVVLLLFSFISTSIRMTKKQIGILRALGAKKSDTFKIYAVEGFIVTVFALALSFLAISIGAPILNAMIGRAFGHYFSLFTIGLPVYLTMTVLALVVTVISVFIPLRKFNRISPVSAISGK